MKVYGVSYPGITRIRKAICIGMFWGTASLAGDTLYQPGLPRTLLTLPQKLIPGLHPSLAIVAAAVSLGIAAWAIDSASNRRSGRRRIRSRAQGLSL